MTAPLHLVWSWPHIDPTALDPTTVTVSRDPDGRWYTTLGVEVPDPAPLPATGQAVGIDLGVTDFAVTSDGERIANPRHLERKARNLARYQRRMARTAKGSANRRKAATKVARAHRKVRAARADFLHRASTRLVREHDLLVIEDLVVKNMVRNRHLARAIADSGWGTFRSMLAEHHHPGDHERDPRELAAGRRLVQRDPADQRHQRGPRARPDRVREAQGQPLEREAEQPEREQVADQDDGDGERPPEAVAEAQRDGAGDLREDRRGEQQPPGHGGLPARAPCGSWVRACIVEPPVGGSGATAPGACTVTTPSAPGNRAARRSRRSLSAPVRARRRTPPG